MAIPSNRNRSELHRVVFRAKSCSGEQKSQNLRIGLGGPARQDVEQQKHEQTAKQAVEQVEGGCAQAHGGEKELPLCPEDGQWPRQRPMHSVDSSGFWQVLFSPRVARICFSERSSRFNLWRRSPCRHRR